MSAGSMSCHTCGVRIDAYYNQAYHGRRGKCPECGIDFPLD